MKDIIPAKKESPILGLSGLGGGVGSNLGGSLSEKSTYVDELFNTYAYRGNATARSINNGIDVSKNGALVWLKNRANNNFSHTLFDTVRGATKILRTNNSNAQSTGGQTLTSFNNNGFSLGTDSMVNSNNDDTIAWTFSKRKGFFDIVTYTGDGVAGRTVAHDLGSIPGSIIIKSTDNATSWFTYHAGLDISSNAPWTKYLMLNHPNAVADESWFMNDTAPTASQFTVGSSTNVNGAGREYVAYIFAGGESPHEQARSVRFTDGGASDYLSVPDDPAWDMNNHDFTIECWARFHTHNSHDGIIHNVNNSGWSGGGWIFEPVGGRLFFYYQDTSNQTHSVTGGKIPLGTWQHMAITKSGSTIRIYQDGIKTGQGTQVGDIKDGTNPVLIGGQCVGADCDADISNVRITTGQVLYTNNFTPSTVPLTTTSQGAVASNVKLLCCNQSTANGYSVSPGAITAHNSPIAHSMSPFDDPDGYKFGENEDQNIIKTGSYIGNGNSDGPRVHLGWEPQWLMVKSAEQSTEQWHIIDDVRGMIYGGNELHMEASTMNGDLSAQLFHATPNGFHVQTGDSKMNNNGGLYIYYAIRRPDPLVAKPPEAGTDVFAIDTGSQSSNIPLFDSGFKVDFGMIKNSTGSDNWWAGSRLTQYEYVEPNRNVAGAQWIVFSFDHTEGFSQHSSYGTNYIGWMWKRHAGFDVVTYKGDGQTHRQIPHNLGKAPEMMWLKPRDSTGKWNVYHKEANGGVNPEQWYILLDSSAAAGVYEPIWQHTAPTATDFTVGNYSEVNDNSYSYLMMLFASVDGISKVGSYTGNGNANGPTVPLGFAPKFILIKGWGNGNNWYVYDTTRGLASGNDQRLQLNDNGNQTSSDDITPSSTGFQVISTWDQLNGNNTNYLYYAHA